MLLAYAFGGVTLAQARGLQDRFAFRRQLVIGEQIVDFACTKVRLVVEVDGAYHEERALNELGWCVARVLEHHVFSDLDAVVACIAECAGRLAP